MFQTLSVMLCLFLASVINTHTCMLLLLHSPSNYLTLIIILFMNNFNSIIQYKFTLLMKMLRI